jgi:2,5-dihydroxypyridine 5,6-dioxygenase
MCEVQPHESVVVLTDTTRNQAVADAFFMAALATGAEVTTVSMKTREGALQNPPATAVRAMIEADVVFDLATHPWLYTDATNQILDSGTRMLQVLVMEETILARPPDEVIARREQAARDLLEKCTTFRITSAEGTDLVMERGDRPVHTQGGFVDRPGDWDSYAVCLGAFAPPEDRADGDLFLSGTMYLPPSHSFITERPIRTRVEKGRLVHIEPDHDKARLLSDWLQSWNDPNSYVIAHTGFGIDHRAQLHPPDAAGWESYLGGVNVAFGANNIPQLGGLTECKSHFDAVLLGVTVEINGARVIENGSFVQGSGFPVEGENPPAGVGSRES